MSDLQGLRVSGPLAGFMPGFADALAGAGYVPVSARIQLELAAHLSRWLTDRQLGVEGFCEAEAIDYLAFRRAEGYTYGKTLKAVMPLLEYLRSIGSAPPAPVAALPSGGEALLAHYLEYLLGERAMTPAAARGYLDLVRPLVIGHCHDDTVDLGALDSAGITRFVIARSRCMAPKTAQRMTSALRSFLRYLAVAGLAEPGLAAAVPKVAHRAAPLPRVLTSAEVRALLDSCDQASVNGRRDYAVLVLLSRLGLRSGEVAALDLDDLDWRHGEVTIAGKGGRLDRLPVPVDVGLAVSAYLIEGRPADAADRCVFVRVKAPHRALTSGGITQIVAAAAARAGLGVIYAHRLRHCAATGMLRGGADLAGIGQVLRHRRAATTAIYARVDVEAAGPGPAVAGERGMSTLRAELADYLAMRRALGFSLQRDGKLLAQFLTFLESQHADVITVDGALAWASLPGGGPSWLGFRMSVVRTFARHMHTIDPAHQVPSPGLLPARRHRMTPYLYSNTDICALLDAADALRYPLGTATYRTLIGLLAATGMRIGDALALDVGDLDTENGVLTIRRAKSDKSRIVPLHPSTLAALSDYQRRRRLLAPRPAIVTPALFVSTAGTRLAYTAASVTFTRLVARAGITARSASCRPRPHDLRHTFAVNTLIAWYRDGGDVAARLPLLSTYLGHSEPKNTYWYLQASPELLELAARRLNEHRGGRL